ncbi:MAG: NAD(P)-binding protein [Deltaproteobacteria bacterium]|nr:NAD(P)-binding protein [Deltaproteobacteria bacterium]
MKIFGKKSKKKVVIVGAGFAGLSAAKILTTDFDVTVIDPWPYFEFLPNIHELVSAVKKPRQLRLSRKKIVENMGHRHLEDRVSE